MAVIISFWQSYEENQVQKIRHRIYHTIFKNSEIDFCTRIFNFARGNSRFSEWKNLKRINSTCQILLTDTDLSSVFSSASIRSPQPASSSTREQRVAGRRPASASRRPPPPPTNKDKDKSRPGGLASKLVALSTLVSAALGGKPACASIAPPCRSPCISVAANVSSGRCYAGRRRGSCSGSLRDKAARVT